MCNTDDISTYGSWVRDRVLGCGGFGIVTLWKNVNDNNFIALKKCRWDNFSSGTDIITKKQKERWSNEVEIMKRLSHRNVVDSIPMPEELSAMKSDLPILSMEFCSLGDLRQVLNKPENCCGLKEIEVRQIIMDIKNAIAYLHSEKITHRDLKPENIVLKPDKNTPGGIIYKLIDLGYAKELDQSSICNSFVGTLQYLAPELFLNSMYTSSVDYWSLGLVSHEIITGVRPFLPNMPPAQWMMHIEGKGSDFICAYQKADDNSIVFRKELFNENHISDYLRAKLEKWLMVALEWIPEKRGRLNNELVIFNMINDIFNKKIVLVFCAKSYKRLSYEVDSATAVPTLKTWIERDVNLPVCEQLLLLPNGEQLSDEKLAVSCWDPAIQDVMLYVLPVTGFELPGNISPYVPELVQYLLKNDKDNVEYPIKRRIWANAVYFIHQELYLYQCFLDAYAVKMLWLVSLNSKLGKMFQESCAKFERLSGINQFAVESLKCDQKFFHPVLTAFKNNINLQKMFSNYERLIIAQTQKLKEESDYQLKLDKIINAVKQRISNTRGILGQLQMFLEPSKTKLLEMKNALKGGHRNYAQLINSKKTEHLQTAGNKEANDAAMKIMIRLLYNFLKVRDKALNDDEFSAHLRKLNSCELEMKKIEDNMNTLLLNLSASNDRVMSLQATRQQDFWLLATSLSCNRILMHQPSQKSNTPIGSPQSLPTMLKSSTIIKDDLKNPSTTEDIRDEKVFDQRVQMNNLTELNCCDNQNQLATEDLDLTSIYYENENIRTAIMEGLSEAHEMMQSIICETSSWDWNSLYSID